MKRKGYLPVNPGNWQYVKDYDHCQRCGSFRPKREMYVNPSWEGPICRDYSYCDNAVAERNKEDEHR